MERFSSSRLVMRYLRYVHYPRAVAKLKLGADVHHVVDHGYAHLLPHLGAGKKVVTVHDLIPMLHWKGLLGMPGSLAGRVRKPVLNQYSLSFLDGFNQVVVPSQNTAADLVTHLSLNENKIKVVPAIIGEQFGVADKAAVSDFVAEYSLETDCKWLMVTGQDFYKNHLTSLKVLKALNKQSNFTIKMIKTGVPSEEFNQAVKKLKLEGLVRSVYLQDTRQLALLYNFIDCLLFPSIYEGFGMPVAEALACGTPVVSSDRGSLPEVGGTLVTRLNPYDVHGLSKAVYQLISSKQARLSMRQKGPVWVAQFRPATVAERMEKVYQNL
ncbi:MAG: glycosyltransferase family 1 protein [Pseudomonadota bacterium]